MPTQPRANRYLCQIFMSWAVLSDMPACQNLCQALSPAGALGFRWPPVCAVPEPVRSEASKAQLVVHDKRMIIGVCHLHPNCY